MGERRSQPFSQQSLVKKLKITGKKQMNSFHSNSETQQLCEIYKKIIQRDVRECVLDTLREASESLKNKLLVQFWADFQQISNDGYLRGYSIALQMPLKFRVWEDQEKLTVPKAHLLKLQKLSKTEDCDTDEEDFLRGNLRNLEDLKEALMDFPTVKSTRFFRN